MGDKDDNQLASYIGLGVVFGVGLGTVFGVVFDNIGIGVSLGAGFGPALGVIFSILVSKK